jgi:hypothetical protein
MKWLLASPTSDDLIRLLKAWRFWMLSMLVGALLGAAIYHLAPPPYRARATVTIDFNLEQAWPQNTDRQLFYYLERETRKLEEVAWSDSTLQAVANQVGGGETISQLRSGKLLLSQPGEGGWHFWAEDSDPQRAAQLASAWAGAFTDQVRQGVTAAVQIQALQASLSSSGTLQGGCNCQDATALQAQIQELEGQSLGINPYIQVSFSQAAQIPLSRKTGQGTYLLVGALIVSILSAFLILFVDWGMSHREN